MTFIESWALMVGVIAVGLGIAVTFVLLISGLVYWWNVHTYSQVRRKFHQEYEAQLRALTAREAKRGFAVDDEIVVLSEFLSEREMTRKDMN